MKNEYGIKTTHLHQFSNFGVTRIKKMCFKAQD